jgi:dipeptidyl aminopeptidase/acylaminoacyl peptidase
MNSPLWSRRRQWSCSLVLLLLLLGGARAGGAEAPAVGAKRPLTHADYDGWRTIQGPQLSRDGRFLAYTLSPQVGDRELVIRNLTSGHEWRFASGGASAGVMELPAEQPAIGTKGGFSGGFAGTRVTFSADNRLAVFLISPTKSTLDQARKDKKRPEEMPKSKLGLLELNTGTVTWINEVKAFQLAEDGSRFVAYQKGTVRDVKDPEAAPPLSKKGKGTFGKGGAAPRPVIPTVGAALIVRNLVDKSERTFEDVADYQFTKDGKLLVLVIASKKEETNGIYVVTPGSSAPPLPVLVGKGRYTRPVWDEKQTQLAFLTTRDDAGSTRPRYSVYHWQRNGMVVATPQKGATAANGAPKSGTPASPPPKDKSDAVGPAGQLIPADFAGLKTGWSISDRGGLTFSADSSRLYLATAPAAREAAKSDKPPEERVLVDLWHWKDEFIQPMQKVRGGRDANLTYRAVFHLKDKRLCQLADEQLTAVTLNKDGGWAAGSDDRPYRTLVGFDANYADHYLLNTVDGSRKRVLTKHEGAVTWSPAGNYLLFFQNKHWHSMSVADGKITNLTQKLPVKFWNEDTDTPSTPPSYGQAGWTADDKHLFLNDQYDIWLVAADGTGGKNLTGGFGRKNKVQFRLVRFGAEERALDMTKPLLLKADNLDTRDQGFYRLHPDGRLQNLITAARSFGMPIKAKDADVMVLTTSTFHDFPDLMVTNGDFRELKKVTNANPQKDQVLWGKAELIRYKSADGTPLAGMLIKPDNFDPNKKYPMIVYIYEKLSQGLHQFQNPAPGTSINASYYASKGYVVLKPDIVYKVGYPGQSAIKCVLPAIQGVVDQGFIDEKAIGIQGHSWGGYQIAYMVTQTNRFAAASAGAPVSNMISAYGGIRWDTGLPRQFQYERTQSRIGGNLWQYPMRFVENSPIFMADRVNTPLLMLHNDQDGAVPWYQGIEYYLALRRLGKEVYMFNYNGEKHGLTKRPNQKDYTVRMEQFFDHHLRGAPMPQWMASGMPYRPREGAPKTATPTGASLEEENK